jgi:AraC-like DNA-binding protein
MTPRSISSPQIVSSMRRLPPTARVEDIANVNHIASRTLQRLFRRYVGVSPKWMLKRLRIHQAVEQISSQPPGDWSELALDLGYYDHAHFIRDFRLIVGQSPAQYSAEAALATRQPARRIADQPNPWPPEHAHRGRAARGPLSMSADRSLNVATSAPLCSPHGHL